MDQLTDLIDLYTIHNTAKNVFVDTIIIATFEKASIIQALHDCHTSHRSHLRDSSNIVNNFQIKIFQNLVILLEPFAFCAFPKAYSEERAV